MKIIIGAGCHGDEAIGGNGVQRQERVDLPYDTLRICALPADSAEENGRRAVLAAQDGKEHFRRVVACVVSALFPMAVVSDNILEFCCFSMVMREKTMKII